MPSAGCLHANRSSRAAAARHAHKLLASLNGTLRICFAEKVGLALGLAVYCRLTGGGAQTGRRKGFTEQDNLIPWHLQKTFKKEACGHGEVCRQAGREPRPGCAAPRLASSTSPSRTRAHVVSPCASCSAHGMSGLRLAACVSGPTLYHRVRASRQGASGPDAHACACPQQLLAHPLMRLN